MGSPPPPYQWRADGGYISPPPPPQATPACPPGALCFCSMPAHPIIFHQQNFTFVTPQPQVQVQFPPSPPVQIQVPPTPPPEPPAKKQKTEKKDDDKPKNAAAPPDLLPGTNYMFPKEHTSLHIFNRAARIWEDKYAGQIFDFKVFKVPTLYPVSEVIEHTIRKSGDDAKGWAVTEVMERGNGRWQKGTTIEYGSDKAKGTLKSMAWTEKRGKTMPPVWLVIHTLPKKD